MPWGDALRGVLRRVTLMATAATARVRFLCVAGAAVGTTDALLAAFFGFDDVKGSTADHENDQDDCNDVC